MMDCKAALEEADGDLEKAFTILREKGIAKAGKRAGRTTGQGVVEAYLHTTGDDYPPQVGVLIEVNCETDFVAKGAEFRKLAKELALQVAGYEPRWVSREDVPDDVLVYDGTSTRRRPQDGKPAEIIPKTSRAVGELWKQELLDGAAVLASLVYCPAVHCGAHSKLQENIAVRRFRA